MSGLLDITKLSTRGQVVIPESVRKELKLKKGDIFTVRIEGKRKIVLRKLVAIG